MSQSKPNLLFSPGPTIVSPKTLQILSEPTGHHRSSEFKALFNETLEQLKKLFQTSHHVFCLTATGTGAMEASLINLLEPNDPVLFYNGGKFGERWGKMAKSFQLSTTALTQEWGQAFPLQEFKAALKKQKFKAFLVQACETSTATSHDISLISQTLKELQPDCLLIVDGITAVGAYALPMDEFKIDALISGSQKALGLPTGLSFVGLSERALQTMTKNSQPKFYFDLSAEKKANEQSTTNFSTPVALIRALNFKLKFITSVGLEKYLSKTKALQANTLEFLKATGCEIFSSQPSPSLTAFYLPQKQSTGDLQKQWLQEGFFLAGGQDQLKGKVLRWGHMGDIEISQQLYAYESFVKGLIKNNLASPSIQEKVAPVFTQLKTLTIVDECLP